MGIEITMYTISFVVPSYNNLRYLKNAYRSIREYAGEQHEVIILDDASTDGTQKWLESLTDENLTIWNNTTGQRLGHTITYNIGGKLAKNEVFSILHADMFIGPNYVENAMKHMKRGAVVSATRIEPPLHPEGKEKLVRDFGMWPETFKEAEFLGFVKEEQERSSGQTTTGIFAPWLIYKEDFLAIGGHDSLFAPFPYEDSDIFQRFVLAGYEIVQSRDSLVYHLTCRGHKWTDNNVLGKVDDSFKIAEENARRNYIRKWNSWIKNDEYHMPILPKKYNTCAIIENANMHALETLEPWFGKVITQDKSLVLSYIEKEQPKTTIQLLDNRVSYLTDDLTTFDVYVKFSMNQFTNEDFQNITKLSTILSSLEEEESLGTYELGNITVHVNRLINIVSSLTYC